MLTSLRAGQAPESSSQWKASGWLSDGLPVGALLAAPGAGPKVTKDQVHLGFASCKSCHNGRFLQVSATIATCAPGSVGSSCPRDRNRNRSRRGAGSPLAPIGPRSLAWRPAGPTTLRCRIGHRCCRPSRQPSRWQAERRSARCPKRQPSLGAHPRRALDGSARRTDACRLSDLERRFPRRRPDRCTAERAHAQVQRRAVRHPPRLCACVIRAGGNRGHLPRETTRPGVVRNRA